MHPRNLILPFKAAVKIPYTVLDYLYKHSFNILRARVDKRTAKHLITKSGYEQEEIDVPTDDGYIL